MELGETCEACGLCATEDTGDGAAVDPCLGVMPGVAYACCGHGGKARGYVLFENGVSVEMQVRQVMRHDGWTKGEKLYNSDHKMTYVRGRQPEEFEEVNPWVLREQMKQEQMRLKRTS